MVENFQKPKSTHANFKGSEAFTSATPTGYGKVIDEKPKVTFSHLSAYNTTKEHTR